jgi:hypothetical protein
MRLEGLCKPDSLTRTFRLLAVRSWRIFPYNPRSGASWPASTWQISTASARYPLRFRAVECENHLVALPGPGVAGALDVTLFPEAEVLIRPVAI